VQQKGHPLTFSKIFSRDDLISKAAHSEGKQITEAEAEALLEIVFRRSVLEKIRIQVKDHCRSGKRGQWSSC